MSSFTARDRSDLRELFRVHDFAKIDRVDEIIAAAHTTPTELFDSLYAQYHIAPLPDRAAAVARLQAAVPEASPADVESAIRIAEVKGFHEADALRALRRELRAATMTSQQPTVEETNTITAETATATSAEEDKATTTLAASPQTTANVSRQIAAIEAKLHHVDPTITGDMTDVSRTRTKSKASKTLSAAAKDKSTSSSSTTPKRTPKSAQAHSNSSHGNEDGTNIATSATDMTTRQTKRKAQAEVLTTPVVPTLGTLTAPPTADRTDHIAAAEVREWVATVVGERFGAPVRAAASIVDALKDGVVLLVLLQKLRDPAMPEAALKLPRRTTGFFMRDNVSTFLREAKAQFGLTEAQLFTNSDLCDGKDERRVVTCLLAIARQAYNRNPTLAAPAMVRFEKEIDAMTNKLTQDDLERIVREAEAEAQTRDTSPAAAAPEAIEGNDDDAKAARDNEMRTETNTGREIVETQEAEETAEEQVDEETDNVKNEATPREAMHEATTPLAEDSGGSPPAKPAQASSELPHDEDRHDATPKEGSHAKEGEEAVVTRAVARLLGSSPSGHRASQPRASHSMPRIVYKPKPNEPRQTLPPRYHPQHWDGIDIALSNVVNAHYQRQPDSAWRFRAVLSQPGEYVMYNRQTGERRQVHVRVIQDRVLLCKAAAPHANSGAPRSWVDLAGALTQLESSAQLES